MHKYSSWDLTIFLMDTAIEDVRDFQDFLASLKTDSDLFKYKTIEIDLNNDLNPTNYLNDLFFEQNKWLNFNEFYEYYLSKNLSQIKLLFSDLEEEELKKGIRARLYRTQFGILTEYHAYYASRCIFGADNVFRDKSQDKIGVDYSITLNDKIYHIHIFVDTKRSWKFRKIKSEFKNADSLHGIHVNLPYSLKEGRFNSVRYLSNGFGIYTSRYLKYLKEEILSGRIQHNNIVGTNKDSFIYAY